MRLVTALGLCVCLSLQGCFSIPRADDALVREDGKPRREVPWFASKELMTGCQFASYGFTIRAMQEGAMYNGSPWAWIAFGALMLYIRYTYDEGTDAFTGSVVNAATCIGTAANAKVLRQQKFLNGQR